MISLRRLAQIEKVFVTPFDQRAAIRGWMIIVIDVLPKILVRMTAIRVALRAIWMAALTFRILKGMLIINRITMLQIVLFSRRREVAIRTKVEVVRAGLSGHCRVGMRTGQMSAVDLFRILIDKMIRGMVELQ